MLTLYMIMAFGWQYHKSDIKPATEYELTSSLKELGWTDQFWNAWVTCAEHVYKHGTNTHMLMYLSVFLVMYIAKFQGVL